MGGYLGLTSKSDKETLKFFRNVPLAKVVECCQYYAKKYHPKE